MTSLAQNVDRQGLLSCQRFGDERTYQTSASSAETDVIRSFIFQIGTIRPLRHPEATVLLERMQSSRRWRRFVLIAFIPRSRPDRQSKQASFIPPSSRPHGMCARRFSGEKFYQAHAVDKAEHDFAAAEQTCLLAASGDRNTYAASLYQSTGDAKELRARASRLVALALYLSHTRARWCSFRAECLGH